MTNAPAKISLEDCAKEVAQAPKPYLVFLECGDAVVELFAPRGPDTQGPHDRDELYIVTSGNGVLTRNRKEIPFVNGDVLFVPAHMPHRFTAFSDDFSTWVIFFGPVGGAKA